MSHEKLDVGELVEQLGGFGKFQILMFILACYVAGLPGMMVANMYFLGYQPQHRCLVPTCEYNNDSSYHSDFLNFTTPTKNESWSSCSTYAVDSSVPQNELVCRSDFFDTSNENNCSNYVYDSSLFYSTSVTEFNLVCDNAWKLPLVVSAFMAGMLVGAFLLGDLGDRIGRKKALVVSFVIFISAGILNGLSYNYNMFITTRFLIGIGSVAMFQINFVSAVEFTSLEWRRFVGVMLEIPFAIGEASGALFAYFIRDWRWIQISMILSSLVVLFYVWVVPESLRWLISKKRYREAKKIIERIEKINNVEVSKDIHQFLEAGENLDLKESGASAESDNRQLLDLFRFPTTRRRTFILMFTWAALTLVYYGLSANSASLGGNVFINFMAIMLIEIPSYIFAYFILDTAGRKGSLCAVMLLGGVACIASGTLPSEMTGWIVTFSMVGKFGVSAAYAVIFVYTSELYPTPYRSIGLGGSSMAGRIGGILAPLIADLNKVHGSIPFLIFGSISIISGLLVVFLPETFNCELPQTIQQSEVFGSMAKRTDIIGIFVLISCTPNLFVWGRITEKQRSNKTEN